MCSDAAVARKRTVMFSMRLPVRVNDRIEVLCALFPEKSRTQITVDLLQAALAEFERLHPIDLKVQDFSDHIPY